MAGFRGNFEDIQAARDHVENRLRGLPNVHAVGIGPAFVNGEKTDQLAIIVYVDEKLDDRELKRVEKVPPQIKLDDGSYVPTDVKEQDIPSVEAAPRRTEHRPVFGGIAGRDRGRWGYATLGAPIEFGGSPAKLTNRHTISADGETPSVGDEVVQPGETDSVIGTVAEWSEWSESEANDSDSAIVDLNDGIEASNYIASVGALGAAESASFGNDYMVSGVVSGVGTARPLDLDYRGIINYDHASLEFRGLLVFENITTGGDSGGVWGRYDRDDDAIHPVGLHFAGGSTGSLAIPWSAVQQEHSQTIAPLTDANASPPQPTTTDAAVEIAPISLTTGQRPSLYCLATRWGDPQNLPNGAIHLQNADSGSYVGSVETSAGWGEPEIVEFEGLDLGFSTAYHDITLYTSTGSESYTIEVLEPTQFWFGGTVTDEAGDPISGADVQAIPVDSGVGTTETTTDDAGEFAMHLLEGQYRVLVDHSDYWADDAVVEIEGASQSHDVTLEYYGDAVNIDSLLRANQLTTDQDGEGRFTGIAHKDYGLKFSKDGYRTKARSIAHGAGGTSLDVELQAEDILNPPSEGTGGARDPPEAGDPEGLDPRLNLPDGPAHFECAVLGVDAGKDYEIPVLVSNTGGELGATDLRIEVDITGRVIASRNITLVPGGATIAHLSVRAGIQSMRLPMTMRVSTVDDDEQFLMSAEYPRPPIANRGLPTTLGGGATVGPAAPYTAGPMREPPEPAGLEFPTDGWSLTLERPNGDRRVIEEIKGTPDIEDTYNELATWSVETPADPSLEEWNYETRIYLARNGRLVTIGWCDSIDQTTDDETATLSGGGPLHDLIGDEHEIDIHQMVDWRAAEKLAAEVAPNWSITAVRPTDSVMVRDESYSGNALEILTSFADDYGFFLRPSKAHFREATISPPGAVASPADMDVIDYTEESSSEGYANEVIYRGDGVTATAEDTIEIRRLAEKLDLRLSEARETVSVRDERADTEAKAEAKAKAELRDRIQRFEVGGEVTMPARRLQPGVSYPLPTDDEVWHTARSLRFSGDGWVSMPTAMMARLSGSGAITIPFRAEPSALEDGEHRLVSAWSPADTVIHTRYADYEFRIKTDTKVARSVSAFEEPPADGEWHLYHADWQYEGDATSGLTTLRAGHDGTIVEETTVDGRLDFSEVTQATIGRMRQDFARATIIETAGFYSAPQSAERYARLARGESIPATDLVSRYDMAEPPGENQLTDAVSGYHARINGDVLSAGRPAVLESADHSLTETTAQFDESRTYADLLRGQL